MSDRTIQERLGGVWESHMHDGNGQHVAAVFVNVLRQAKKEGAQGRDFPARVVETAFEPFENEADGGMVWALMANAESAMAGEFKQWLTERKQAKASGNV